MKSTFPDHGKKKKKTQGKRSSNKHLNKVIVIFCYQNNSSVLVGADEDTTENQIVFIASGNKDFLCVFSFFPPQVIGKMNHGYTQRISLVLIVRGVFC